MYSYNLNYQTLDRHEDKESRFLRGFPSNAGRQENIFCMYSYNLNNQMLDKHEGK